jgi:hypothetical protein
MELCECHACQAAASKPCRVQTCCRPWDTSPEKSSGSLKDPGASIGAPGLGNRCRLLLHLSIRHLFCSSLCSRHLCPNCTSPASSQHQKTHIPQPSDCLLRVCFFLCYASYSAAAATLWTGRPLNVVSARSTGILLPRRPAPQSRLITRPARLRAWPPDCLVSARSCAASSRTWTAEILLVFAFLSSTTAAAAPASLNHPPSHARAMLGTRHQSR